MSARIIAMLLSFAVATLAIAAEPIAIVNARLYTATSDAPLDAATIVMRDGVIEAVGRDALPPAGARIVDAGGRLVTPGLMNGGSDIGLVEIDAVAETADAAVSEGPLGAAFDVRHALNANSTVIALARADGLTRAVGMPTGSGGAPFSGSGVVLRLVEGPEILDRPSAAMFAVIGGMAAESNGGSRSAQWILLRNAFDEARMYRPARGLPAPRDQLLNRLDIAALQPVLDGRMPLAITAERESDIRAAMMFADDYRVRVIVMGGTEAWRVAGELAARNIPVVLNPADDMPGTYDRIGARADNAAILARAGVTIAFYVPGIHMTANAGSGVREAAGLAVANGLPWQKALNALTVDAARIWGISDHYGSLAKGQDADVVIWDGDPLEPSSSPVRVFVRGIEASIETRQTLLRKRYAPRQDVDSWPPAYH
jgi:imidazolonepropionase-like amidohydrolase